ncbi:MAG: nitrogen fixation protein NifQ [Burkholderiales bacterium]|nr:nitrogen fixation protein NifQ [Burkholderiales bacterium]
MTEVRVHAFSCISWPAVKFFYRQLCERAEFFICKSPSCGTCVDCERCFGAEDSDPT